MPENTGGNVRLNEGLGADFCHQINGDCHDYFKLRVERDQLREELKKLVDAVEPFVGRFADGEPINPLGHAFDEATEYLRA